MTAEEAIKAHNKQCVEGCEIHRKDCGFKPYGRQCPECPKDWMIDFTPSSEKQGRKVWLWKNFVDGRPEYWAFDNPYPCHPGGGDPLTLGEPCGYAIIKESTPGRTDVSDAEVIAAIKRARGEA